MQVGIIGYGWVGKAMAKIFPDALIYDPFNPEIAGAIDQSAINNCDIAFICVPTPATTSGALDTSIVEQCIIWCEADLIVVRSTVNPGDCDRWTARYNKRIVYQPEYLGETVAHPLLDMGERPFMVIGGHKWDRRVLINLYTQVYNSNIKITQLSLAEAEVVKLSENRAIAFKVMQMHELYKACESAGIDYYAIRDAVYGDDPRFNLWFTFIYPNNLGFNSSKCLVKDVPAWAAWAESVGVDAEITKMLIQKSTDYQGEEKEINEI